MPNVSRPLVVAAGVAVAAAVVGLTVAARLALGTDLPGGWYLAGASPQDYAAAVDPEVSFDGRPSVRIASTTPPRESATVTRGVPADAYRGRRVRLSGAVRARDAAKGASLWMRVDSLCGRAGAAGGTTPWRQQSIVLDVAADAADIQYGLLLEGGGTAWASALRLEVVPASVPVTAATRSNAANCGSVGGDQADTLSPPPRDPLGVP
jgi:hypothetical protein